MSADSAVAFFDEYAEQALLGSVIQWPDQVRDAFMSVPPEAWFRPGHADLAGVLGGMLKSGQGIDAITVGGQAQSQGLVHWGPLEIFKLSEVALVPQTAPGHAKRITALSGRRKLHSGLTGALQRLESATYADEDGDVRVAADYLRQALDDAEQSVTGYTGRAPTRMGDFLQQESSRNWLVPGLLERMDRTVITGGEGAGKSVLCRQVGACLAGGVHPFGGQVLGDGNQGVRVLVLDCENSPDQSRRGYHWIVKRVDEIRRRGGFDPVDWNAQMAIDAKPAGIDLLGARDRAWLEHSIQATAPDLLVLGPLYKLHHEDPSDEKAAREVAYQVDGLRERYGFALLTEAHAGKGTSPDGKRRMAPIGSSMWLRWPEFGFGLRRSDNDTSTGSRARLVDVVPWRGSREERAWPNELHMGNGDVLPWVPDGDYFKTMNDYV